MLPSFLLEALPSWHITMVLQTGLKQLWNGDFLLVILTSENSFLDFLPDILTSGHSFLDIVCQCQAGRSLRRTNWGSTETLRDLLESRETAQRSEQERVTLVEHRAGIMVERRREQGFEIMFCERENSDTKYLEYGKIQYRSICCEDLKTRCGDEVYDVKTQGMERGEINISLTYVISREHVE